MPASGQLVTLWLNPGHMLDIPQESYKDGEI